MINITKFLEYFKDLENLKIPSTNNQTEGLFLT